MFLVLCNTNDLSALWAYQQLKQEWGEEIDLVTADMLAVALRWEHRITASGVSTAITLGDGRVIRSEEVHGTLNRLDSIPVRSLGVTAADRDYAAAEMRALFASWLHALPEPVLNRATPAGLSGSAWRSRGEWMLLASRAGFTTSPLSLGLADVTTEPAPAGVMVIGRHVIGGPTSIATAALALSRASDAAILGIELSGDGRFQGATPYPDLRAGGVAAIAALREALREKVAA